MLKHKPDFRNISRAILLSLVLFGIFTIVGPVGSTNGSAHITYYANDYNISNGTHVSGSVPSSVTSVYADYPIIRNVGTDTSVNPYNPSGYTLLNPTSWVSDSISNLTTNDEVHRFFSSYSTGTDMEDYVDINTSNVDSSADKGAHSNFTAQQSGPDLINDTLTEENTGTTDTLWLYVNADDETRTDWTRVGTSPYLDANDYNTNYVWASGNNLEVGDFGFTDSGKSTETIDSVEVQLYANQSDNKNLEVFAWDGSSWTSLGVLAAPTSWEWMNWTATTQLDTWTKIDGAKVYIETGSSAGTYEVDCARLEIDYTESANYELDLEVQWTNVDFDETNEQLCINGGPMDAEDVLIDVWNGSGWENLFTNLNSGWNNVSITSYLDSATFTIRFKGGTETGDTTQDSWNIDAILLHVWTDAPAQPFDWVTPLSYALPVLFGLLVLFGLILKRRKKTVSPKPKRPPEGSLDESKPKKPDIAKKTDVFSGQFGMTHEQIKGKKMLLEIDPASDYHTSLLSFVSEAKNNNESLFIFTIKNSTLHSTLSGVEKVNFRLLTSKTSSPRQINDKETLLPASDLSVLLHAFDGTQREDEKPVNVIFDNLSDIILRCGFEKTYKFMRLLLETISSPKATALFVFNPTAHDQTISSSIRGLFKSQLVYAKSGPEGGTL